MDCSIQEVVCRSLRTFSNQIAIEYGDDIITYKVLDSRSNYVADALTQLSKQRKKVGIFLHNRVDIIVSMIGIIKAGDIFVPLDVNHLGKLKDILGLVECDYIITDEENREVLLQFIKEQSKIILYRTNEKNDFCVDAEIKFKYGLDAPIYIFFTSGTSNIPKAILGKNKSLVHFIQWESDLLHIGEGARVSQLTFPTYDAILRDIFTPLFVGGTICIPVKKDIVFDSSRLSEWIEDEAINVLHCTPTIFRNIRKEMISKSYSELQFILLAGESIIPQELKKWYQVFGDRIQLINLYGPSETTMVKTFYFIKSSDVGCQAIPIGKPMNDVKIHIVDEEGNLCGVDTEGEIFIETEYTALGYYCNEELTKKKYVYITTDDQKEVLAYRTGDCGRYREDGNIEYLGRKDRQIKKLGNRIELGEIENVITTHQYVDCCYIHAVKNKQDSNVILVAYCVTNDFLESKELIKYLEARLPYYMMPNQIVFVDRIPVKDNGKIDIDLLSVNSVKLPEVNQPVDEIEAKLVAIWSEILGTKDFSIKDNFLHIGGHSLLLMTLISKIYEVFEIELTLEFVFDYPYITSIADYIRKAENQSGYHDIDILENRRYYPLSAAQRRIFISEQLDDKGIAYNLTNVFLMNGCMDIERLQEAVNCLAQHHESLRTSFDIVDGEMRQEVHTDVKIQITTGQCEERDIDEYLQEYVKPFELGIAPLFRMCYLQLGDNKVALVIDMHHLIADGRSVRIVLRDLLRLYHLEKPLDKPHYSYSDYVYWFEKRLNYRKEAGEHFWSDFLNDCKFFKGLPTDFPISKNRNYYGASIIREMPDAMRYRVQQFIEDNKTTLFIYMFLAFSVLYGKYAALEDIVIGSPVEGRKNHKFKDVVGMFVNVLPIRCRVASGKRFSDYLTEMQTVILNCFEYDDYQIDDIISMLQVKNDVNGRYLFDTLFSLQYFEELPTNDMNTTFEYYDYIKMESENLRVIVYSVDDKVYITFRYSKELFSEKTIQRMMNDYFTVIENTLKDKDILLQNILSYEVMSDCTELAVDFNF